MSTGERLRRARLDAGKTLDQVAADTKIQLWILEAIERDDLSRVPGGIFVRGYLTAFARAVGVSFVYVLDRNRLHICKFNIIASLPQCLLNP